MPLLVLSAEDVFQLIRDSLLPPEILANQADVFQALHRSAHSAGRRREEAGNLDDVQLHHFEAPLRTVLSQRNMTTLVMPARLRDDVTCKLVSVPKESSGLSAATAVLDAETGGLKAIVNAAHLTALRTAAGSVLATLALQPLTDFHTAASFRMTIFGGGKQAIHHAALFNSIYGDSLCFIDFVVRTELSPKACEELQALGVDLEKTNVILTSSCSDVKWSVSHANVVICCTPSQKPLFSSVWVQPGTHIVLVGSYKPSMQEVDAELVHRARGRLIVDDCEACSTEAGDLIKAGINAYDCVSLGAVLSDPAFAGLARGDMRVCTDQQLPSGEEMQSIFDRLNLAAEGGRPPGDITMFKSVGVGLQDVAITSLTVEQAIKQRIGQLVHF